MHHTDGDDFVAAVLLEKAGDPAAAPAAADEAQPDFRVGLGPPDELRLDEGQRNGRCPRLGHEFTPVEGHRSTPLDPEADADGRPRASELDLHALDVVGRPDVAQVEFRESDFTHDEQAQLGLVTELRTFDRQVQRLFPQGQSGFTG